MFPASLLNNLDWFIRDPVSEAKPLSLDSEFGLYKLEPNSETIITTTPKYIIIAYQVDRYSTLDLQHVKYKAESLIRKTIKCETKEEYNRQHNELLTKYKYIWTDEENLTLKYPAGCNFTVGEILRHIARFYSSILSKEELLQISKTDDGFGYSDLAKDALQTNSVLYREQIMGDCMRFEGLSLLGSRNNIPIYQLNLGS